MYTDQQLLWAAQIAYCNIKDRLVKKLENGEFPTLQQIFIEQANEDNDPYAIYFNQKMLSKTDGDEGKMAKDVKQFIDDVIAGKICQGWKVVSVKNEQEKSGMFALTIETGENEAIVAFRGSEAVNVGQFSKDWGLADFCMINGKATDQEEMAYQYLTEVGAEFTYENLTLTGHSLGGNLSHVATVYAYERAQELYSRIRQSVSFDGPGHPQEYIKEHQVAIDAIQDKLMHYQWSLVGTILTSFCQGDNYQTILSDKLSGLIVKHATESLRFNEDGSLIRTEKKDWVASVVDALTNTLDEINCLQLWVSGALQINFNLLENSNELYKLLEKNKISEDKISNYTQSLIRCYGLARCWFVVSKDPTSVSSEAKQNLHRECSEATEQYIAAFKDLSKEVYDTYGPGSDVFSAVVKTVVEYIQDANAMQMDMLLINNLIAVDLIVWLVKKDTQRLHNQYEPLVKLIKVLHDCGLLTSENVIDVMAMIGKMYMQEQSDTDAAFKDFMKIMENLLNGGMLTRENAIDILGLLIRENAIPDLLKSENAMDVLETLGKMLFQEKLSPDEMFKAFMKTFFSKFVSAGQAAYADPLVFDMDGDGFELLTKENGVYFDEDNVGLREKTEWVGADDALLAVDWNGDGVIGDGSELFGTSTLLRDGGTAKSGFEALAQYDDNGDGRIDAEDGIYSQLVLWQDKNGDGISQEDEMYALEQMGIESISLQQREEDGINVADVNFKDGTSGKIGEFIFDSDLYDTIDDDEVEISEGVKALPNVRAVGAVESLHVLMQRDETGTLMAYVAEFVQSGTVEERWDIVQRILYFITGADKVKANSRGNYFDAQKLTVIERLMGQDFVGMGGRNPISTAAPILEELYHDLAEVYYTSLMADSYLKEYINMTFWATDKEGKKYLDTGIFDMYIQYGGVDAEDAIKIVGEISRYIRVCNPDNRSNFENYLAKYADNPEFVVSIAECAGLHMEIGTENSDEIRGCNGSNYSERDVLYGGEGDDKLYGNSGNDILIGGAGDDYLNGGYGSDTYIYNRGDGNDTIDNNDSSEMRANDRLVLGGGIRPEDIAMKRDGKDLVLTDMVTNQTITVRNAFENRIKYLENIVFEDGTVWGSEYISGRLSVITGTENADELSGYGDAYGYDGNETIYGGAGDDYLDGGLGNDTLYGGDGDDKLYGGNGNDILIGGAGDDYLSGGGGVDTYVYNRGDGNDTIYNWDSDNCGNDRLVFGEGIRPEEIVVMRSGNNIILTDTVTGQTITILGAFQNQRYYLYHVEFADGTEWTQEDLQKMMSVIRGGSGADTLQGLGNAHGYTNNETFYGGEGNDTINASYGNDVLYGEDGDDTLYGGNDDDTLIGGAGDDYLNGSYGVDTYIYNRGDGNDVIDNSDPSDTWANDCLVLGGGIRPEDIAMRRDGNDLVLTDTVTNQTITLHDAFKNKSDYVANIVFEDGTVWGSEYVSKRLSVITGTDGEDRLVGYGDAYGYDGNESIHGGAGDDYLDGNFGNDTLYGDEGNDKLYGNIGDDTLVGGAGDDYLNGGYGSDTYIYNRGDGNDTIDNSDSSEMRGNDRLVLGGGIRPEDIAMKRDGKDLVLTDTVTNQTITVRNAFENKIKYLENIVFEDGTVWGSEYISGRLSVITGTENADELSGYGDAYGYDGNESIHGGAGDDYLDGGLGDDTLYGSDGDDKLYGGNGNDILIGGAGDDYLSGGDGSDTYVYNRGDGNDSISNSDRSAGRLNDRLLFGEGIKPEEIKLTRNGDHMILTDTVTGQKITVQGAFWGQWNYLYRVEFADGTAWTMEDIQERLSVIRGSSDADTLQGLGNAHGYTNNETFYGGEGNDTINASYGNDVLYGEDGDDTLYGGNDDDTLIGGAGDDYLNGSYGVDTYIYNRGDGNDVIDNSDPSDTWANDRLVLGGGIRPEEIAMRRDGNDLVLTDTVTNQTITLHDAFKNKSDYVANIVFEDGTVWGSEYVSKRLSVITGTDGEDRLVGYGDAYGYDGNESIHGGAGDDYLDGDFGNDTLYGDEGNDKLYGGIGDDTLVGGAGDDYLNGGYGSDTYIYNRGDGNDTIDNNDLSAMRENDRLVLGGGIRPEEIGMKRDGKDFVLTDTVTNQTITVRNAFENKIKYLENIVFEDGTVWGSEYVSGRLSVITGTDGADELSGYGDAYGYDGNETIYGGAGDDYLDGGMGDDTLYGGDGDDKLYGDNGNDILIGGAGDDYLSGGYGSDTYIYNRGDGNDNIYNWAGDNCRNDRLVFGEGIQPEEIELTRYNYNLILTDTVTGQKITIEGAFLNQRHYLHHVEFADGTSWTLGDIWNRASVIQGGDGEDSLRGINYAYKNMNNETFYGGAGNDTIYGLDGNDVLYGEDGDDTLVGGTGDDYLCGGNGSDTYLYHLGDGNDTIHNNRQNGETDTLMIGTDISELTFSRMGDDLLISVGGEDGSISVENWYSGNEYQLDSIQTSDGYALAGEQVDLLIQAMASFESTNGMEWQDALSLRDEQAVSIAEQYWVKQVG